MVGNLVKNCLHAKFIISWNCENDFKVKQKTFVTVTAQYLCTCTNTVYQWMKGSFFSHTKSYRQVLTKTSVNRRDPSVFCFNLLVLRVLNMIFFLNFTCTYRFWAFFSWIWILSRSRSGKKSPIRIRKSYINQKSCRFSKQKVFLYHPPYCT